MIASGASAKKAEFFSLRPSLTPPRVSEAGKKAISSENFYRGAKL